MAYAWQLKKDGKADATVETTILRLKRLTKLCNISEPEQVKAALALLNWKNTTKNNAAIIYTGYLKYLGNTWTPPKYMEQNELPFIPTEQEIDCLINAGHPKTAALLQLLKETGARIGEIEFLKWTHVDAERKAVYITAEKGSNSRILPASPKLLAMLNNLPKINDNVFQTPKHSMRTCFEKMRGRTASKLNNPRLKQIHFHTFRHWKATMEYHKTKDIIHVKTMLGHRSIVSTMIYINIESAIWLSASDEWTCKVAQDATQASQLIEIGFEYVTGEYDDGGKLFRKRK
jgi:integrase